MNYQHRFRAPASVERVAEFHRRSASMAAITPPPIVDKAGVARFVHYGHAMSDIPENAELLALLDQLDG